MKFVKNYMKNLAKSTVYVASDVAKNQLTPNIGEFASANKEVFTTTYGLLRNPKQQVRKSVEYFKQSKIYQAIDYGARNTFEDLRTGKWYNKERDERDEGRLAGLSADDYDDLSEFGIDDNWDKEIAKDTGRTEEISTGDVKVMETIEKTSAASATTTSAAIAAATDISVKNSRTNTAMMYNQNERLFGGLHNDISVVNATLNSLMKLQTETFQNLDSNTSRFFTESIKLDTERNAMIKEILEMERNKYKTAIEKEQEAIQNNRNRRKKKRRYGDIVLRDGMPDLGEYFENVKDNIDNIIKSKTGGMMSGFSEDGNMFAAMLTSPLKYVLESAVTNIIPQTLKEATKEFDSMVSGVFGTLLAKLGNADEDSILGKLNSIFGVKNGVNRNIDTSKYEKGPVPFDGITRKAIIDVIPTYLRRIESALTGREEAIYDYKNGKWSTFKEAKTQYDNIHKSAVSRATSDLKRRMLDAKKKMAIKDYRTNKELDDAIDEFMEVLYDRNGDFNPSKSLEKNGVMGKQNLRKHYDQIMRLYSTFDAVFTRDKKGNITGLRNKNLSNRLIAGNVFDARSAEERAYREAELDPANIISTFFEGKGKSNLIGKFVKKENGREEWKFKNNLLLASKDKNNMNVFDYLRNINMELKWQREEAFQYYVAGVGPTGSYKSRRRRNKSSIQPFNAKKFATSNAFSNISITTPGKSDGTINDLRASQAKDEAFRRATLSSIEKGDIAPWLYQSGDDDEQRELLDKLQYYIITKNTEEFEKELYNKSNANTLSRIANSNNNSVISYKKRQEMEKAAKELEKEDNNDEKENTDTESDEGFFKRLMGSVKKSRDFIAGLVTGPAETFTNLLYTADRAIYDMLFKQKILKDENDPDSDKEEYDGFINFLVGKTTNAFKTISDKITDNIINPLKDKLGIGDDFKDRFVNESKRIGKSILGKFITANKETYSPLIENLKEELGLGDTKKDNESGRERRRREARAKDLDNLKKVRQGGLSVTDSEIYNMIKYYGGNPLEFDNAADQADYLTKSIAKSIYDNSNGLKDDLTKEEFDLVFNTYLSADNLTVEDLTRMIKAAKLMNVVEGKDKNELLHNFKNEISKSHSGTNKLSNNDYIKSVFKNKQSEYLVNNKSKLPQQYQNKYASQFESGVFSDADREALMKIIPNPQLTIRNAIKSTASDLNKNFVSPNSFKNTRNILVEEATNIINNKEYYKDHKNYDLIKNLTKNDIVRLGNNNQQMLYKIIGTFGSREDLELKISENNKLRDQYRKQQEFLKNTTGDKENREAYITNRFKEIISNKAQYSSNKNYNLIKDIKLEDVDKMSFSAIKKSLKAILSKDEWARLESNYQRNTLNRLANYNAKGTINGKPFMGDTMLSKGELLFNNNGVSVVPETNAYRLNQPTQILNSYDSYPILKSMGINLGSRKTPSQDLSNENKVKRRLFNHSKGTIANHDNGTIKIRSGSDVNVDEIIEQAKTQVPEMAAGGLFGGILSLVLGLVGGPLLGAAVGAGASLISSSDSLKDKLFGEKNEKGKRNGGKLFNSKVMDAVNKYLPDMTKYGLAGIIPGLLTPLGPIGGLLVGGAIGAIKNNEAFTNRYFGEDGKLTFKSNTKKIFDKAFKPALAGGTAGIIAKALGFGLGGPLGLAGNMLVGSMLGVMTTTDEFKDLMLGMEINGVRHGGLAGTLRDAFEPLKNFGVDIKNKLFEVIDKQIADPLQRFIVPTIHSIYNIAGILPRTINRILESHFGKSLKSHLKSITAKAGNSIAGKAVKGVFKGAGKVAGALNPLQMLGRIGDAQRKHHIRNGEDNYETAEERLQFMRGKNASYDDRFDTMLAGIGNEGTDSYNKAKSVMDLISQITDTAGDINAAYNKSNKRLKKALGSYHTSDGGTFTDQQIKDMTKAIKSSDPDAVRAVLQNTTLSNGRTLSDEEYKGLMNSKLEGDTENLNSILMKNLDLKNRKNKVGTYYRNQRDRDADFAKVQDYLSTMGITVNNSRDLRKYASLIQTELINRQANPSTTIPESTQSLKKLTDIDSKLGEMLNVMRADAMGISPGTKEYNRLMAEMAEQDDAKAEERQKAHQEALKEAVGEEAYENMSDEARDRAGNRFTTPSQERSKYLRFIKPHLYKYNSNGKRIFRPHIEVRAGGNNATDKNLLIINKYIDKPIANGNSIIERDEASSDILMKAPLKALDNIGSILKLGWNLDTKAKEKIVDITVTKAYGQDFKKNLYNILKKITVVPHGDLASEELDIIMRDGNSLVMKNTDIKRYGVANKFDLRSIKDLSNISFAQIRNAAQGDNYSSDEEPENHAFGTILGIGKTLVGGALKATRAVGRTVGSVAKGAFRGVKNVGNAVKRVLAPNDSDNSAIPGTVGSNGDFAGFVTNPEHPDETVKYKYNSTGGKEPDTSDAETRDTLNKISLRQRLAEKASKARDKAAETINKAFGNEMPESNKGKLHWWEVLAAGIFAAPYLKKIYDKVIKPVWDDKIYPWIQNKAMPWISNTLGSAKDFLSTNVLPAISSAAGSIVSSISEKLPELIGTALAKSLENLPSNIVRAIHSFWKEWQSNKNKDHDKSNTPKDIGGAEYKSGEDGSSASYFYTYDKSGNKINLTLDDIRTGKYTTIYNEQGVKGTLQDDGKYDFDEIDDNGKNGYKNRDLKHKTVRGAIRTATVGSKGIGFVRGADKVGKYLMKHGGIVSKTGGAILRASAAPVKGLAKGADIAKSFIANPNGQKGIQRLGSAVAENVSKETFEKGSKIVNSAGKAVSGAKQTVSKAISSVKGTKAGGLIEKLISSIQSTLEKIFTNKGIISKFGGAKFKDIAEAILSTMKSKLVKLGESGIAKIAKKAGGFVLKHLGPIMMVADAITGADQAAGILGVEDPSVGERLMCGAVKLLINIIPMLSLIIDEYDICPMIAKKINPKGYSERNNKAKEDLAAYNKEHGTNYSMDEFLNKDTVTTKVTKAASKVGSTIKNAVGTAGKTLKSGFNKVVGAGKGAVTTGKEVIGDVKTIMKYGFTGKAGKMFKYMPTKSDDDNNLMGTIRTVVANMAKIPMTAPALVTTGVRFVAENFSDFIEGAKNTASEVISDVGKVVKYGFTGKAGKMFTYQPTKSDDDNTVMSVIRTVVANTAKVPMTVPALVTTGVRTVANGIKATIDTVVDVGSDAKNIIALALNGDTDGVKDYKSKLDEDSFSGKIAGVTNQVTKFIATPISYVAKFFGAISDWIGNVGDWIKKRFNNVVDFFKDPVSAIKNAAVGGVKSAGNWIKNRASDVANFFGFGSGPKYGMGYKQTDPAIRNIRYNAPGDTEYQTIGDSGCGPAAAVNAVSSIYGRGGNPIIGAARMAIKGGYKEKNGGTRPEFFKDYFNKNGLDSSITTNKNQMVDSIKSGNPVVLMGKDAKGTSSISPFGKNPHYVTVTGTDGNGNAVVQDPESNYDNQVYKMKDLIDRSSLGVSAYGRSKYGMGYPSSKTNPNPPSEKLPASVTRYKKTLIEACKKHGVSVEWVDFLMSMMTCESHGSGGDPMQAAEGVGNSSQGTKSGRTYPKKQNGISNPTDSCYAGVYELKSRLSSSGYKNPYNKIEILDLAQGYNFGGGFIDWLKKNKTHYTLKNAIQFGSSRSSGEFAARGYGTPNHALKVWAVYKTTESGKKAQSGKYGNYQATSTSGSVSSSDDSSSSKKENTGLFSAISDLMDNSIGGKLYNALNGTTADKSSDSSSSDNSSSSSGSIASNANKQQAADLISSAASNIGYREKGNNLTKFGEWYGMNGQPWCAMFVSYNANKAKIPTSIIPKDASTKSMYSWFKKKKELVSSPSKGEPGDLVFFADANGNESGIHHVGIVEDVSGGEVHTIEGNTSDQVRRRSYKTSEKKLLLTRPAYTGPANANKGKSNNKKFAKVGGNYNTRGGNNNKPLSRYGTFKDDIKNAGNYSYGTGGKLVEEAKRYNKNHNASKLVVENDQAVVKYGKGTTTDNATLKLIQTIITILTEIADNTDKLSTITSILQDKLDVKITSKDISNKTNKESLKAKLKRAITNKSTDADFINANNDSSLNSIVLAMNSIAAE